MPLLSTRHCERAVAKRRGCEGCQVTTAVPIASVSVKIDREERTCRARGACGFATRNDIWREAVGSERPRVRETPYHFAKMPAALAVRLLAGTYVPQVGQDVPVGVLIAAVTGWCINDGLECGTRLGRWGTAGDRVQCATECGRVGAIPGRPIAVHRGARARPVALTGDFRRGEGGAAWTALTKRVALA